MDYYNILFKDFPDILTPMQLKKMLGNIGTNKIYKLLQDGTIYSKKIGKKYKIPKVSLISYIMNEKNN
ncbi:MAG: helix-turn-helix domain-containing protein [Clostridia bacterium]|nr:helix-turn-helix domain-containing protein [Clostridia bacterium]